MIKNQVIKEKEGDFNRGFYYANLEQQPLQDFDSDYIHAVLLDQLNDRICEGKPPLFFTRKCFYPDCGKTQTRPFVKDNGEIEDREEHYRAFCCMPYCKSPDCRDYRMAIAKRKYRTLFYAYPSWLGRNDRWLHIVLGTKRMDHEPTKKELNHIRKQARKFLASMERGSHLPYKVKIRVKAIGTRDLSGNYTYYVHYHFFLRPIPDKYLDFEALNKLAAKYDLKFTSFGYRSSQSAIKYLAKRDTGIFGHNPNHYSYADIMSLEEYFNSFHKTRRTLLYGFSRKEVKFLNKRSKEAIEKDPIRNAEGVALSSISVINDRKKCQFCGNYSVFKVFDFEIIKDCPDRPPPSTENMENAAI